MTPKSEVVPGHKCSSILVSSNLRHCFSCSSTQERWRLQLAVQQSFSSKPLDVISQMALSAMLPSACALAYHYVCPSSATQEMPLSRPIDTCLVHDSRQLVSPGWQLGLAV